MKRNINKTRIITFLCIALVFMGIGYAVLQSNINISGVAKAGGSFNVEIIDIKETEGSSSAGGVNVKNASYEALSATFNAKFTKPGDYVEYIVTVKNKGTIDAVLSSRLTDIDSQTDTSGNQLYYFTALDDEGLDVTQYRNELDAGESKDITVKILFNENAVGYASEDAIYTLLIEAVQKSSSDYDPSERLDKKCFVSLIPGEINYYDMNNPECGSDVVIYDGLKLPVRSVTSYEFNEDKCIENSELITASRNLSYNNPNDVCTYMKNEFDNSTLDEIINSDLSMYAKYQFGEESGSRNLITKIGTGAFGTKNITSVAFNNNITMIGELSFTNTKIKNLALPENISEISNSAFFQSQIEGTVSFPKSLKKLGSAAFEINSIENVVFDKDSDLTEIPTECFNQNKIETISLPYKLETINIWAFSSNQLKSLDFENNTKLKTIDGSSFATNKISTIIFGSHSSLETIGSQAFRHNVLEGTLTIPASVQKIESMAFAGAVKGDHNKISNLVFEENSKLQSISSMAFYLNDISGTLDLPESLQKVSSLAFANNKIETLNIGHNLLNIGVNSFTNNKIDGNISLNTINIDMTESEWNTNVKYLNTSGEEVETATWYSGTPAIKYKEG